MAYSVDLTAAIKANKQNNHSKAVDFPTSSTERPNSFRDSLKDAVRGKDTVERKPDSNSELRKELVNRSEAKLKSFKKPEQNSDEKDKSVEESNKEQTDKVKQTIEEMLSKLDELTNMQQLGEVPVQKQTELLNSIKEALKELTAFQGRSTGLEAEELQSKTSELAVKLAGMLNELKADGSLMNKEAAMDLTKELKSAIEETAKLETAKPETASKAPADSITAELPKVKESISTDKAVDSVLDNTAAAQKQEKEVAMKDEGKTPAEASEEQKQGINAEASAADTKQTIKNAQPAAEEPIEEVKSAIDNKVEKVTVEGKESKNQDADAESSKEAPQQAPKAINSSQQKQVNEEMAAIRLEQAAADNQVESVQNQVPAAKTETVNKTEIINQIVKKAEILFTDAKQEMRMQLEPENLGKLNLKLAVEKGLITAKFVAESYEVKQVIESHFNELKDMLQEKGLEVQNFSVSVGQDSNEFNNGNAFQQWKETVKLNGRSLSKGSYDGYQTGEAVPVKTVNPYSIHNGKFDHRA